MSTSLISSSQIRAARHLANRSQTDIASATGLSLPTIRRAESERDVSVSPDAIAAIQRALEAAGVIFMPENGDGPGVKLRKKYEPGTVSNVTTAGFAPEITIDKDHRGEIITDIKVPAKSPRMGRKR
jgi:transcriptional regulator with XRE-family HTH domain